MCLLTPAEEWIRGEPLTEEHWSSQMSQALRTASNGAPGTLYLSFTLFHFLSLPHLLSSQSICVCLLQANFVNLLLHMLITNLINLLWNAKPIIKGVTKIWLFPSLSSEARFMNMLLFHGWVQSVRKRRSYFKGAVWHFGKCHETSIRKLITYVCVVNWRPDPAGS